MRIIAVFAVWLLTGAAAAGELREDDRIIGNRDAPATIVEYASLTCPHCRRFHVETLPELKRAYLATGKARLAFRDFPLDRLALAAAMVARCAGPERSLDVVGRLFETQPDWTAAADPIGAIARHVEPFGLDRAAVERCINDEAVAVDVLEQAKDGQERFGIEATPTFIVNGRTISGAQDLAVFEEALRLPAR